MRINGSTKSKVGNIIRTVIGVGDSNGFSFEVKEANSDHVTNAKTESRMKLAAVSASFSTIAVLISKYVATVVTKSLQEMDGDPACPRNCRKNSLAMRALRYGGAQVGTGRRVRMVSLLASIAVS